MSALTLPAFVLSVACGLALAGADYFRKVTPTTVPTATVLFYFLLVQVPLLGAGLAVAPPAGLPGAAYWGPALADAAFSLAGNALFIVSVRRSPLTMVVPLLSFIPVITIALGALLLGEWPALHQGLGVGLAAAGVMLLYLPPGSARIGDIWRSFRAEPGALPMVGVALAWSMTAPLDKMAVAVAGVALHGAILLTLVCSGIAAWLVFSRDGSFRVPPGARAIILWAGLAAGVSFALQLAAYSLTLVAFVEALKRVAEIGVTVALGVVLFRESHGPAKIAGLALILCGVPLMLVPASG
jgi:drug/metabolite transporter (DMT)-like permease